jgi:hypothetical protein
VTAELTHEDLRTIMEEVYTTHDARSLMGFDVRTTGTGQDRRVTSLTPIDGPVRARSDKYVVAFNTFDSRSAGHRFMKLRAILETTDARCKFHEVQTRDALIDYFRRHKVVEKGSWACPLPAAA